MPSPRNRSVRLTEKDLGRTIATIADLTPDQLRSNLYCGDVLAALERLPDASFDLIVADPPYNYGIDFGNESDRRDRREYLRWTESWINAMVRVAAPTASIYVCSGWEHSGDFQRLITNAGLTIRNRITWKREKGRGAKTNWKQNMEDIWYAVRDPQSFTFNLEEVKLRKKVIAPYRENGEPKDWAIGEDGKPYRMTHPSNIWVDLTVPFWSMPENTAHPTQKPEALVERIVLASSNAGDQVLDLFSGSGTTSVVAKKLGREFIGVELNPEYVRFGMKRIEILKEALAV